MSVYVDNMKANFGRMVMCHMVADSLDELHEMADKIGMKRKWFQPRDGVMAHYDISLSKRALAVQHGAKEITIRQSAYALRHQYKNRKAGLPIYPLNFEYTPTNDEAEPCLK